MCAAFELGAGVLLRSGHTRRGSVNRTPTGASAAWQGWAGAATRPAAKAPVTVLARPPPSGDWRQRPSSTTAGRVRIEGVGAVNYLRIAVGAGVRIWLEIDSDCGR